MARHRIGAWTIGLAVLAGAASWAQAPEGQWVPQESPSVEEENQRNAWDRAKPELPPSLLRLLQSEEDEATEEDRAAKSAQNETDDLVAQQKAADAAYDAAASAYGQQVAAWVSVGAAAAATLVAGLGTWFVIGTFRETRRTAKAAIDGVVAANRAAKAAERANKIAAIAAKKAVAAAAEANRISREAIANDQRPWIEVKLSHVSGLTFDERGAHITVKATFVNHGRSPALNVFFVPNIVAGPGRERMEQMMKMWNPSPSHLPGEIVYPGSDLSALTYPLTLTPDVISLSLNENWLIINIIACVNYQSNIGAPYTTRIAYDVFAIGEKNAIAIMINHGDYAREQISISRSIVAMSVVT